MKISEAFEGPNSSLRKAFDEAASRPKSKLTVEEIVRQYLEHPAFKHLQDIELTAIITGRAEEYEGERLSDWLTNILTTLETQHTIDVSEAYAQGWNEGQQALGAQHREEVDTLNRLLDEAISSLDNPETETYLQEKREALKPN